MYSSYYWTRYTEGYCLCILLTTGLDILKDVFLCILLTTGLDILKDVVYVFFLLLD